MHPCADHVGGYIEVLRAECHIVGGHRRDDLILGILELRADATSCTCLRIGVGATFVGEHRVPQERHGTCVGRAESGHHT